MNPGLCMDILVCVWMSICETRFVYGCIFVNPGQCMDVSL